jgi:hypothetical protein
MFTHIFSLMNRSVQMTVPAKMAVVLLMAVLPLSASLAFSDDQGVQSVENGAPASQSTGLSASEMIPDEEYSIISPLLKGPSADIVLYGTWRIIFAFTSLVITVVPLTLMVGILIWALHSGRPVARRMLEPFFGQGQVTQLVVVILVAGNVCTMAIAGILGASEVSAIYGGIIGYILGKKTYAPSDAPSDETSGKNPENSAGDKA